MSQSTHLEDKAFVEDRVKGFSVDFRLVFLLLVWQEVDLDVGVRRPRHVHAGQVSRLDHTHGQLQQTHMVTKVDSKTRQGS